METSARQQAQDFIGRLSSTSPKLSPLEPEKEPEIPYILTTDDEEAVLENAARSLKTHTYMKLKMSGRSDHAIADMMEGRDFRSEIDRDTELKAANKRFWWKKQDEEWAEKRRIEAEERYKEFASQWTAEKLHGYMQQMSQIDYNKEMIITEENKNLRKALCYFISSDPRLETELNFSPNKGLMIRGNTGIGKTYMVKCIAKNDFKPIKIHSMHNINHEIKNSEDGSYNVGGARIHYIDDVGTGSPIVNYYGTKVNWFQEFIELQSFHKTTFNHLIISTNCSFDELEQQYGFRVRSRLAEMFNVLDVTGEDMRKK